MSIWLATGVLFTLSVLVLTIAVAAKLPAVRGLRLAPIRDVICTSGDAVRQRFTVQDADHWRERIEFAVRMDSSADASIDRRTGNFVWHTDRPGRYTVTVNVQTRDGKHSDSQRFRVLVKPI